MPLVSVIIPTNVKQHLQNGLQSKGWNYLSDAISSVMAQTYGRWEIVLLINGEGDTGGCWTDPRIRHVKTKIKGNVGALKREACKHACGQVYVELDHDDMLTPDAIEKIVRAFESDEEVGMVYSNSAEFYFDYPGYENWTPHVYDEYWGWKTRDFEYQGHDLKETVAFAPTPGCMRSVWFAPNHVRAWKASAYHQVGGHDASMPVVDDHDLCARFYIKSKVLHIDECLYLYRVHTENTYLEKNEEIQRVTAEVGARYAYELAEKWCDLNGWRRLDLCGGINSAKNYETVDCRGLCDHCLDLDITPWNLPSDSFGLVRAFDALEHLKNPIATMNEIHRILKPGGILLSRTPSTDGRGAFADPTHVSFWNELSFRYYTDKQYRKYLPDCTAAFQTLRLSTYIPASDYCESHNIVYVDFDAVAIKPEMDRWPGELLV